MESALVYTADVIGYCDAAGMTMLEIWAPEGSQSVM